MRKAQIISWLAETLDKCIGEAGLERGECEIGIVQRDGNYALYIRVDPIAYGDGRMTQPAEIKLTVKAIRE